MTAPIFLLTASYVGTEAPRIEDGKPNRSAKLLTGMCSLDAVMAISILVIGILAATSVMHISPSVAHALIGLGSFCGFSYGMTMIAGIYMARAQGEKTEQGFPRLISQDLKNFFKIIPGVLKSCCVKA